MLQVKISVYKDGSEVAWAIFGKNPGAGDVWFDPSRIIDSYPWNKSQLQENTARFLKKGVGNRNFWMISEGVKYNTFNVGTKSAHAHWLTILTGRSCDLRVETAVPAIMYSKVGGPVFLGTRSKFFDNCDHHSLFEIPFVHRSITKHTEHNCN